MFSREWGHPHARASGTLASRPEASAPNVLTLIAFVVPLVVACGSAAPADRHDDRLEALSVDPAPEVEAAATRVEAGLAREDAGVIVEGFDVRFDNIGYSDGQFENNFSVVGRVPFANPAEISAARSLYAAETDVAILEAEMVALEERVRRCDLANRALAAESRVRVHAALNERVESVRDWTQALLEARRIDEIEAFDVLIEGDLSALDVEPMTSLVAAGASFEPPDLNEQPGLLVADEGAIRAQLTDRNPSIAARSAAADRYTMMSEREASRNRVHLDFLELRYYPLESNIGAGLQGQVAFYIPWPGGRQPQEERYVRLSEAERFDGRALEERMVAIGHVALDQLAHYESRREAWEALQQMALEAAEVADQRLADHRGDPRQLLNLYRRAYAAQRAFIDDREFAGEAACSLLSATGVRFRDWPRTPGN